MKRLNLHHYALISLAQLMLVATAHAQIYNTNGDIEEYNPLTTMETNSIVPPDGSAASSVAVSNGVLYVAGYSADGQNLTVGTYDASTLAPINPTLASTPLVIPEADGSFPAAIVVSGNDIYVGNSAYYGSYITKINATTGAVDPTFTTTDGTNVGGMVVANNILYIASNAGTVATFNATTGHLINGDFVTLTDGGNGDQLALVNNTLYVIDAFGTGGNTIIGTYDATTGDVINANFITGYEARNANTTDFVVAVSADDNYLYVGDDTTNTIGAYNLTTGAFITDVADTSTRGGFAVGGAIDLSQATGGNGSIGGDGGSGDGGSGDGGSGDGGFGNNDLGATPEPRSMLLAIAVLAFVVSLRLYSSRVLVPVCS